MRTATVFVLCVSVLAAGEDARDAYRAEVRRLAREDRRFWKGYQSRENAAKAAAMAAWRPPAGSKGGPFGRICDHAEYERLYAEAEALGSARGAAALALARSGHAKAVDVLFSELLRVADRVEDAEALVWDAKPGGAWGGTNQRHGILRHGLEAWWKGLVQALAEVPGGAAFLATEGYKAASRKDGRRAILRRVAVLDALGMSGDPAAPPFLEAMLAAKETCLRIAAVEGLVRFGKVEPLAGRLSDESVVVRRALLAQIREHGGGVAGWVRPLLAAYRAAEGQLRADCVAALASVTGRDFGDDPERWEAHARGEAAEPAPAKPVPAAVTFYGIASPSRSVVFVMDGSFNMLMPVDCAVQVTRHHFDWWTGKGGRHRDHMSHETLQRRELSATVAALSGDCAFGVVLGGTPVKTLPVHRATAGHRSKARRLMESHAPGNWRSELENLVTAMELAGLLPLDLPGLPEPRADTIFLVCDGSILAGRFEAPDAALAAFRRLNRFRHVVVHVVHICEAGEYAERFLKELARMTGGTYRRVREPPA